MELTTLVVIGTNCTDSYKSNYHMITTKTAPKNSKPKWDTHIPELGYGKKNVKIPKRQSQYVNRRRKDNTMATRKSTKG